MDYQHNLRIPLQRIGALLGKGGKAKNKIEKLCDVEIIVDSKSGDILLKSSSEPEQFNALKATDIIIAIGRGFSSEKALQLINDEVIMEIVDLRNYTGKSTDALTRIKGRIIGLEGKTRKIIEELTNTNVSIYGYSATILGSVIDVKVALEALHMLASGKPHRAVYRYLEGTKRQSKIDRLKLWEDKEVA